MKKIDKGFWMILLGIALFVRLWHLAGIPLQGDEYFSLQQARQLGLNLSGLLYFVLLRLWMQVGQSDWWYRLLSVMLGMAAVPFAYWVGRLALDRRTGLVCAAFVAVSPFAVQTSQEVRHYILLLTTSTAALAATLLFLSRPKHRWRWMWLGIALLLLSLSHLMGFLFAGVLVLFLYTLQGKWPARPTHRLVLIGVGLSVLLGISLLPITRGHGWRWLVRIVNLTPILPSVDDQMPARGLSMASVAKIPFTLYIFSLGRNVHPLTWPFVIPAALAISASAILGVITLRGRASLALVLMVLCLIPGYFLVLESLAPYHGDASGPKFVTMVWPAFVLLLAAGAARFLRGVLVLPLLLINVTGLGFVWFSDWSYSMLSGPDWRAAADFAFRSKVGLTAILHDGRSKAPVAFYFPDEMKRIDYWPYLERNNIGDLTKYSRLILLTNDYKVERRQGFNQLLERLDESFNWVNGRVYYPFFEYILERKPDGVSGYTVMSETGQIRQPLSIYGLEFQDLRLPITVEVEGIPLIVIGSLGLPDLNGRRERIIPLAVASKSDRFVLLSNIIGDEGLIEGTQVAEVVLESEMGEVWTFPLHLGIETETWGRSCPPETLCATAYRWHKRMAFVSQRRYPDSWRDFRASLHGVVLHLPQQARIVRITLRYLADRGHLYVWGLALPFK